MIPLVLDTETALASVGCQAPPLACVSVSSRGFGLKDLRHWTNHQALTTQILAQPDLLIVGHTISYDMAVLATDDESLLPLIFAAYDSDRITCTETRAKLLDIAAGTKRFHEDENGKAHKSTYSLQVLAKRFLNRTVDKNTCPTCKREQDETDAECHRCHGCGGPVVWRLRYGELRHLPLEQWPEGAKKYPLDDVITTEDLFYVQDAPENQPFLVDQFRQARAAFWIKLMSIWGVRTDAKGIKELSDRTNQEYKKIAKDLATVGLLRPDTKVTRRNTGLVEIVPGSRNTKAAQARIVQAYAKQYKEHPKTKRGAPSLDEQACIDSGDDVLVKYSKYTSLGSILSKEIPALERGLIGPIHSYFDPLKETGRTGSRDPNLQNLRRLPGIRECLVPRCLTCGWVQNAADILAGHCLSCAGPICCFAAADYSGLELATQAQMLMTIFGRSTLARAINNGIDAHLMIAAELLNQPYDMLKDVKDRGPSSYCVAGKSSIACGCSYCIVDNARQTGKVANFGFAGGLGSATLVFFALTNYGVRITENEAKKLKKIWLRLWPEFEEYFRFIDWHTKQTPPRIQQLFTGRYRCGSYTELCNTTFQGLGADIAKAAGWEICKGEYLPGYNPPLFGTRTCLFTHDDYLLETPEPRAHETAMALADVMIRSAKQYLPDVHLTCQPYLTRRMSRKAKPVWQEGRLIPWGS